MLYRDRVIIAGRSVPAAVKVQSALETLGKTGSWGTNAIQASVRPSTAGVEGLASFEWRGESYQVQAKPQAIYALGRLDHWEINGEKLAPA